MERRRYYGVPRRPKQPHERLTSFDPIDPSIRYYCCDCRKVARPGDHAEHVTFPINEVRLANNSVDVEIVPVVRALIVMGFGTIFSCYGHIGRLGEPKPVFPSVVFRAPAAKIEPLRAAVQRIAGRALDIRPDGDAWRLGGTPETERRWNLRDVQELFDRLGGGLTAAAQQLESARQASVSSR